MLPVDKEYACELRAQLSTPLAISDQLLCYLGYIFKEYFPLAVNAVRKTYGDELNQDTEALVSAAITACRSSLPVFEELLLKGNK